MVIAFAVYVVFAALAKLTLVVGALFLGLVITALLRPLVDRFAGRLPRGLAVAAALLLAIVAFGGIFTFVAGSVAGQSAKLTTQFVSGLSDLERSVAGAPFHLRSIDLTQLGSQARDWVTNNGGSLAGQVLGGAGVAVEVFTGFILGVFCSVFFLASGDRIWTWLLIQKGGRNLRWEGAARDGWATLAG